MARPNVSYPARQSSDQQLHFLRLTVAYNTPGISDGVRFKNKLPSGSRVLFTHVNVSTAFNAGTTNVLTVGQNSSSYNDFVASGDVDEAATGSTTVFSGADVAISSDTDVYVKYTQSGTAATAGAADVIVVYAPNIDG